MSGSAVGLIWSLSWGVQGSLMESQGVQGMSQANRGLGAKEDCCWGTMGWLNRAVSRAPGGDQRQVCVCVFTTQMLRHTDTRRLGARYSPDTQISYSCRLTHRDSCCPDSELLPWKLQVLQGWGLGGDESETLSPARNPGLPLPASFDARPPQPGR